jgi:hypothetical protein
MISSLFCFSEGKMVGAVRFELTTSCTRNKRATRLRYAPTEGHRRCRLLFRFARHYRIIALAMSQRDESGSGIPSMAIGRPTAACDQSPPASTAPEYGALQTLREIRCQGSHKALRRGVACIFCTLQQCRPHSGLPTPRKRGERRPLERHPMCEGLRRRWRTTVF